MAESVSSFPGRMQQALFSGTRSSCFLAALLAGLLLPSCFSMNNQEEVAFNIYKQNSKSYYNNGNYREAIDQCRKGLELEEDDFSLRLTLAYSMLKSGGLTNLFSAYAQFKEADDLTWFDTDFRVQLGLGEVCYRIATHYQNQLTAYENRVQADPEAGSLFEEEIEDCQEGMEDYLQEAITLLTDTLSHERQQENVEATLILGQAYAYSGDLETALVHLGKGLEYLEKSTSFEQERLEDKVTSTGDGRRFFQRQITRNLQLEKEIRGIMAFVLQRQADFEAALAQYNLLEERDLFDDIQHYNRGVTLQELGRYNEAIIDFKRYLSQASITGKEFDEDEHFHLAFERIEVCEARLGGKPELEERDP